VAIDDTYIIIGAANADIMVSSDKNAD